MRKKSKNSYATVIYEFCEKKYWIQSKTASQSNLYVGDICLSFISDMGVTAIQENLSQSLVSIGLPNEISEIRASNFIKSMPNLKYLWYWNNYPISSLESQCPNLIQNRSWHQEIGVPGHGDSIWFSKETRFGPTWERSQTIHKELLSMNFVN